MKKILNYLLVILLIFLISSPTIIVFAEQNNKDNNLNDYINELIEGLDLNYLEELYNSVFNNANLKDSILKAIRGEYLTYEEIINIFLNILKVNYRPILAIFSSILSIIILCSVLSAIKPDKGQLKDIIFIVCYCGVAVVIFSEGLAVIKNVGGVIENLTKQTQAVFPLLLTLLSASGANASSVLFKPICIFSTNIIGSIISKFLLPIIILVCILSILSALSEKLTLNGLNEFLQSLFKWIIGLIVAIFSIFLTVKGVTASTYDGLSLKAVKYAIGSGIPFVGGIAKQGVDLVITASVMLKNAVGSVFIFLLLFILLNPFMQIIIFSLSLKLLSAITQPIADSRITSLIKSLSKSISMLTGLLAMIFIIYFLTILLIIGVNGAVA